MATRRVLAPSTVPPPGGNFALGTRTESFVFSGGQVGTLQQTGELAPTLDAQIRAAVSNLEAVLVAGGSGLDQIVKTTCYLADIGRFAEFDQVYGEVMPLPYPSRTTVGVAFAGSGDLLFEIEAIARVLENADD